jgi:Osmosensitive K+ channel histidine kinase
MEIEKRIDPDELLASLEKEGLGKLTIFLGAAAGVGKTYAMLEAAREKLAEGMDVVVGLVETHGRAETEALLQGLQVIPTKPQDYKGKTFCEMDLDGILVRRPQIVLVDELAHTNVIGSRHKKRFQDVQELLAAGIDVYTTLNIQHVETLNDIVAQITGITVRETVPDKILETASQIKLIDIPPEELIQRLKDGMVYIVGQAAEALKNFFRPGNINALRELALRYTAQRIDRQLEAYMRMHGIAGPWSTGEKILVCISASPFSAKLIRIAKRMATSQNAEWLAIHVQPSLHRLSGNEAERDSMAKNLRLAETLGAEIIGLTGDNVAEEILELAKKRNVSQIIIGKPEHTRFWEIVHGPVVDKVIRHSQGISIHVIPGSQQETGHSHQQAAERVKEKAVRLQQGSFVSVPYILSIFMMLVLTLLITPLSSFLGVVNISMLYLLPVLYSAARWGRLPAVITAAMGVITFDFFFVPPIYMFTVADIRYLLSFTIFLLVGLITGTLSARLKNQIYYSRQRESRVSALYALSKDIAAVDKLDTVLESIVSNIASTLEGRVVLLLPNENAKLVLRKDSGSNDFLNESEMAVATWVFEKGQKAGRGTETLGAAAAFYLPLSAEQGAQGVLGICFHESEAQFDPERIRLLEAFVGFAAMAINRIKLAEQARRTLN